MKLAQEAITNPALGGSLQGKTGIGFFQSFVPAAIGLALVVGAVIFLFVLITGAIAWMTSGGDKASVEAARGKVTSALVGFIVLAIVFVLIQFMEVFFDINILTLDIGPLRIQ